MKERLRRLKNISYIIKEVSLYPNIKNWLSCLLSEKYPRAKVITEITANKLLSKWLEENNLDKYFDDYITYEIRVDITGVIINKNKAIIAFIECKNSNINLKDISQILGYSRVAMPDLSMITSPYYISKGVYNLLEEFGRYDVIRYSDNPKHILRIFKWDINRNSPDYNNFLPKGILLYFLIIY
ncbi:MAG: hypothetical protein ACUVWP_02360 [bacterium]